ncbi:MAG TPA: hypothetical protein VG964_02760 [Candidatus Saccharimonadales bacterium]|nr:hypothetical protein [Candidatus Saccharimonadales bacterium]
MHVSESAADVADLIEAGRLDCVMKTVTELHLDGLGRRALDKALAELGAFKTMAAQARVLEGELARTEASLRVAFARQAKAAKFGFGWIFKWHIRSLQGRVRDLKSDIAYLYNWAQTCLSYSKVRSSAPIPAAVCMLREAARAARSHDAARYQRLWDRAVERFGADEVHYVVEAFRLSFTPRLRPQVERPRAKFGFAG